MSEKFKKIAKQFVTLSFSDLTQKKLEYFASKIFVVEYETNLMQECVIDVRKHESESNSLRNLVTSIEPTLTQRNRLSTFTRISDEVFANNTNWSRIFVMGNFTDHSRYLRTGDFFYWTPSVDRKFNILIIQV